MGQTCDFPSPPTNYNCGSSTGTPTSEGSSKINSLPLTASKLDASLHGPSHLSQHICHVHIKSRMTSGNRVGPRRTTISATCTSLSSPRALVLNNVLWCGQGRKVCLIPTLKVKETAQPYMRKESKEDFEGSLRTRILILGA